MPFLRRGGHKSSQVFSGKADEKNSVRARQRCDLTRPNAALSPWRQVRRPLRPDEHPCRQGTLLDALLVHPVRWEIPRRCEWVRGRAKHFTQRRRGTKETKQLFFAVFATWREPRCGVLVAHGEPAVGTRARTYNISSPARGARRVVVDIAKALEEHLGSRVFPARRGLYDSATPWLKHSLEQVLWPKRLLRGTLDFHYRAPLRFPRGHVQPPRNLL